MEKGEYDEAYSYFQESLKIREDLASRDSDNSEWQRDIIVSNVKMGELFSKTGELNRARGFLERALTIVAGLGRKERLAPRDAWMGDEIRNRIEALIAPAAG